MTCSLAEDVGFSGQRLVPQKRARPASVPHTPPSTMGVIWGVPVDVPAAGDRLSQLWFTGLGKSTSFVAGNKQACSLCWRESSITLSLRVTAANAVLGNGLSKGEPGTCTSHLPSKRYGDQRHLWEAVPPNRHSSGAAVGLHFGANRTTQTLAQSRCLRR